jgi:hypothetical protein
VLDLRDDVPVDGHAGASNPLQQPDHGTCATASGACGRLPQRLGGIVHFRLNFSRNLAFVAHIPERLGKVVAYLSTSALHSHTV